MRSARRTICEQPALGSTLQVRGSPTIGSGVVERARYDTEDDLPTLRIGLERTAKEAEYCAHPSLSGITKHVDLLTTF